MTIYHWHHIIPKHMGGSDDPSNLVRLTVKEHAAAHKTLYEEHGRWQDELAWKALSGMIGKDDIFYESYRQNGIEQGYNAVTRQDGIHNPDFDHVRAGKRGVELKTGIHNPSWDKSIGGKLGGDKCRVEGIGFCNPNFDKGAANRGARWIHQHNNERKCKNDELELFISEGWKLGRKSSFRK